MENGNLLQIIETIIIIIGFPLLIYQIWQQTKAINLDRNNFKFSAYIEMMNKEGSLTDKIMEDESFFAFYDEKLTDKFPETYEQLNEAQRKQYLYLGKILSSMEQAYLLWSKEWLDDIDFRASLKIFKEIISLKKFEAWWNILKPYYRSDFMSFIENCRQINSIDFFENALKCKALFNK